jgi:threonine dehydrogenase-like Zn-dependent dehydrogenase
MKAVVFHDIGDIRLEDVSEPKIQHDQDAIVRITASAICGTDLHMIRGTMPGMRRGTVLGHEAVGIIEDVGRNVRNLKAGDRVVVCSTIACGSCAYCLAGYYAQCDRANPNGPSAGTSFFGGPVTTGAFDGLQAEYARVPYANVGLVKLPADIDDDQAILLSDIFPTGYFGAELAEIRSGDTVAVFGCGPVGQFAIASSMLLGAGRVIAIDCIPSRLDMARDQGAEVINFDEEDPVEVIRELTAGIGPERVIDAVGIDAVHAHKGPAAKSARKHAKEFDRTLKTVAPKTAPDGDSWHPGDAPQQALLWAVESVAKAGTISIIGVYSENMQDFPIGKAMNKNATIQMGNCHHRRYVPELIQLVQSGVIDPARVLTQREPMTSAIDAYKAFDTRQPGWVKVELMAPTARARPAA